MHPIVHSLDATCEPGRDLVWCASLDLAWGELRTLVGGPVRLDDRATGSPAAALVRDLNASPVTREVADPRSVVALAGLHTEAWVRRVEAALRERFGDGADARLLARSPRPDLFAAYAFLARTWTFATPLMRGHGQLLAGGVPVESFGLWESAGQARDLREARADQILVHFHRFGSNDEPDDHPAEEFVVELVTGDRDDRLLVARMPPQPTLAAAARWALARASDDVRDAPGWRLEPAERFEAPCLDFDLERRYAELEGHGIVSPTLEGEGQAFGDVIERVRFRLDEGGAQLLSEARLGGLCLPPRCMVCHLPFLVLLVRRRAPAPLLALWLETPALLTKTTPAAGAATR